MKSLEFSAEELTQIDGYAQEGGINIWEVSTDIKSLPERVKG